MPVPLVTVLPPRGRGQDSSGRNDGEVRFLRAHAAAVIPVDGSASAVDVGTLAFDPRVHVGPDAPA